MTQPLSKKIRTKALSVLDERVLRVMPGTLPRRARMAVLRSLGATIAPTAYLGTGTRVVGPEGLTVKDGVVVARDCTLDARGKLTLEDHALIGFETVILTRTHVSSETGKPIQQQGMYDAPVTIGARTWVGTRAVFVPGASTGEDAIVASMACVTRDVEPKVIVGGVPARVIQERAAGA
ncbi:acyltransferase [Falsarthrobacter nasiphocae]|uniref:Acetyltransferase-like isoleucine patch superfamily enzyme n=1 Tax=Falsarthrobacter nasiphocae TaxID=189863 RepID=A0AAE3YIJ4_9MICC|nr:acyltransferase [Falsarthrobacter nasiphocae]MDR6892588.1 acetyltransferase-like isoleucine patch superfamily enzyme [Falsarthrobacter nasiphocae]